MATAIQTAGFSAGQLALMRRTVAKDCDDQEFSLFFEAAKAYGLDPFRKQISALVFSKDKPEKRQLAIIVNRDGLRVIAARRGDYRPASEPAQIERDEALVGPTNPKGLVAARVRLWKQDKSGEWFPVIGEAYWDEFAPVKDEWAYDEAAGKRRPTGVKTVGETWARMPALMLTKVAEAQALRAGWPDAFGGLYVEEEMARATADEMMAEEAERERLKRVGGRDAILMSFDPSTGVLDRVALGQAADRCLEFLCGASPDDAHRWSVQNREALKELWARAPSDALEVKKVLEPKLAEWQAAAKADAA